jgi:hypothetical protein
MYNQYLILSDAKRGREKEHDDWYFWVHVRDVMAARPAAVAAQCFRRAAVDFNEGRQTRYQQNFLSLYENTDPVQMTGSMDHLGAEMMMSSATDTTAPPGGGYYDAVIERLKTPDRGVAAAVVVEWLDGSAATPAALEWYIETRFAALMKQPALLAGWLGEASAHQIYGGPRPGYVAVYRVDSLQRAAAVWKATAPPWDTGDVSTVGFSPVSDRLTRVMMLAADETALATAQQMRAAVVEREQAA